MRSRTCSLTHLQAGSFFGYLLDQYELPRVRALWQQGFERFEAIFEITPAAADAANDFVRIRCRLVRAPYAVSPELPEVSFRPLTRMDLSLLHEWLTRPHVAEWWSPTPSLAEVEHEYGPLTNNQSTTRPYIVVGDGAPIGFIQSYVAMGSGDGWWQDERDPGVRGIDQFLAHSEQLGRGLGGMMVRAFVQYLFADPAVTRIQTDPSPQNRRAIRCYEKAGFRAVGEVDTPDGPALLMVCDRAESTG